MSDDNNIQTALAALIAKGIENTEKREKENINPDKILPKAKETVDANHKNKSDCASTNDYLVNSTEAERIYRPVKRMTAEEIAEDDRKRIERGYIKPGPYGTNYENKGINRIPVQAEPVKVSDVVARVTRMTPPPKREYVEDIVVPKRSIGFQPVEKKVDMVNVANCVNLIMDVRSSGGSYDGGSVESIDDDGQIINVPYFSDAGAIIDKQIVKLGTVFTPYFLKVYFACLVMWSDQKRKINGAFRLTNGIKDILDIMGVKKTAYRTRDDGVVMYKYHNDDVAKLKETLLRMNKITIRKFREKEVGHGDGLIEFSPSEIDDKNIEMMHARLVAGQLATSFFQIPRACIELPKEDIPYVIGISYMIRKKISSYCLKNKPIEAPIDEWLEACGQDVSIGRKKHVAGEYYEMRYQDVVRVSKEIGVGDVTMDGINLRINPSYQTIRVYHQLIDTVVKNSGKNS